MRPWRECCSRQCFFRYFEAHFHLFRTFSLIYSLFRKKVILSAKTSFEGKKLFFCVLGHLLGSFSHPGGNVALDNGFFGVLRSIFSFFAFLEPIFGFFAPKCTFGAKNCFWAQKAILEPKMLLLGPLAASQPASQPAGRPASQPASRPASRPASQPRRLHQHPSPSIPLPLPSPSPLPPRPPRPPPHSYHRRWVIW